MARPFSQDQRQPSYNRERYGINNTFMVAGNVCLCGCPSLRGWKAGALPVKLGSGGVGEWLNPAVLKTVRPERVSGGRIPPPPPLLECLGDSNSIPRFQPLRLSLAAALMASGCSLLNRVVSVVSIRMSCVCLPGPRGCGRLVSARPPGVARPVPYLVVQPRPTCGLPGDPTAGPQQWKFI